MAKSKSARKSKPTPASDIYRRQGYHHGNLPEALIRAARDLIAERGPAGFTLVEAARRAGVSAAAPYRHFKDRDALVAEVCRRGFEEFGRRLAAAADGADTDPVGAFGRMGQAYLGFAREEPGFYSAMFAPGPIRPTGTQSETGDTTFVALVAAIARFAGALPGGKADLGLLAYQVWALSHGIATLTAAGLIPRFEDGAGPNEVLNTGVFALIAGATAGLGAPNAPRLVEPS